MGMMAKQAPSSFGREQAWSEEHEGKSMKHQSLMSNQQMQYLVNLASSGYFFCFHTVFIAFEAVAVAAFAFIEERVKLLIIISLTSSSIWTHRKCF